MKRRDGKERRRRSLRNRVRAAPSPQRRLVPRPLPKVGGARATAGRGGGGPPRLRVLAAASFHAGGRAGGGGGDVALFSSLVFECFGLLGSRFLSCFDFSFVYWGLRAGKGEGEKEERVEESHNEDSDIYDIVC